MGGKGRRKRGKGNELLNERNYAKRNGGVNFPQYNFQLALSTNLPYTAHDNSLNFKIVGKLVNRREGERTTSRDASSSPTCPQRPPRNSLS